MSNFLQNQTKCNFIRLKSLNFIGDFNKAHSYVRKKTITINMNSVFPYSKRKRTFAPVLTVPSDLIKANDSE
jgi:hypothetical protein